MLSFLTSNIHGVTKIEVSSAKQVCDDSPETLIRRITITGRDEQSYELTVFSNDDEKIILEVS